jgi:immune inhibitor A
VNRIQRRRGQGLVLAAATSLVVAGVVAGPTAGAAPAAKQKAKAAATAATAPKADRDTGHLPKHPLKIKAKRDAQKQAALERIAQGKRPFAAADGEDGGGADNQFVELENEGTDRIFVILAEFGNERYKDRRFSDRAKLMDPQPQAFDGPLHNQIPAPNRATDNSTLWQADYNRAHYTDMYFNRMREYYETQSSGRYSFNGDVVDWVKVPFNQALYGRNYCGDIVCDSTKALVRDAMAVWVDNQMKAGQSMAQIKAYLKTFDIADRYDNDGDDNYNEPDGFIDHFQIVHAGGDEASDDPTYGSDAIWSHRWYANLQGGGPVGEPGEGLPGVNIGSNGGLLSSELVPNNPTGVWVGDYTIQPENGGLGVFAHEYAHDLGLPDLYDTSGNTGGAENNTAFWTLMSSGANIGDGGPDGIGDNPTDMGVWELFQLGWLSPQGTQGPWFDIARAGQTSTHTLSTNVPASDDGAQALFTVLPTLEIPLDLGPAYSGEKAFWGGSAVNLNNTMTTEVSGKKLTAQVNYDIETNWDFAFLEASTDGGETWLPVKTNLSADAADDLGGLNFSGTGMTGDTGGWVDLKAKLPKDTDAVRFRYQTDGAVDEPGFRVDDIRVDKELIGTAEDGETGWELDGFTTTSGSEIQEYAHFYVAENRQYDGYDASLQTAYNFSYGVTKPNWVETYPYQNGLLVSYWNTRYSDNNVGDHPGEGLLLPVDARPALSHWPDNTLIRNRVLSSDSTFGREATDAFTLHREVDTDGDGQVTGAELQSVTFPSRPAVPTFDDTMSYWTNSDEHGATGAHPGRYQPGWYGVNVPKTGTTITVDSDGPLMTVTVAPKATP